MPYRFNAITNKFDLVGLTETKYEDPVAVATTANLTATYDNGVGGIGATLTNSSTLAAFSADGVTPGVGSRILVKNQSTPAQNGIYVVTVAGNGSTAWVLTRATNYNSPNEITAGDLIPILAGDTQASSIWVQTETVTAVGVSPINFSIFSAGSIDLHTARFIVGELSQGANFTTIAAALVAAVTAGGQQTIYLQDGTYTENISLTAGINLASFASGAFREGGTPNVTIKGKVSASFTGTVCITGINLETNGDYCLEITGANLTKIQMIYAHLMARDHDAVNITSTGGGELEIRGGGCDTGGNFAVFVGAGTPYALRALNAWLQNNASATAQSTFPCAMFNCLCNIQFTTSGTRGFLATNSFLTQTQTIGGSGGSNLTNCQLTTVVVNNTVNIFNCKVANTITGSGTLISGGITLDAGATITVTNQIPVVSSNDAIQVTTPGAYPYTVKPQDALILVDSSVARTINLNATPVTGQKYFIKDDIGSASSNNITISPAAGNIDGSASYTISEDYGFVLLAYDGVMWVILSSSAGGGGVYHSLSPFIVGSSFADYSTIQAAIDAAVSAGATVDNQINVYIKNKGTSYVEDLTFAPGVNLIGFDSTMQQSATISFAPTSVVIEGNHSCGASGTGYCKIQNVTLAASGGSILDYVANGFTTVLIYTNVTLAFDYSTATTFVSTSASSVTAQVLMSGTIIQDGAGNCMLFDNATLDTGSGVDIRGFENCKIQCIGTTNCDHGTVELDFYNTSNINLTMSCTGTSTVTISGGQGTRFNLDATIDQLDFSAESCTINGTYVVSAITTNWLFINCLVQADFTGTTVYPRCIGCVNVCSYRTVMPVITTNYQATVIDDFIPCDTSGGVLTVTLPATPFNGQTVTIKDATGSAPTNTITISGNINQNAGGTTITQLYGAITFTYCTELTTWLTS